MEMCRCASRFFFKRLSRRQILLLDSLMKLRQIGIVSFSIKRTALAVGGAADY
jgi:hypothetical protein